MSRKILFLAILFIALPALRLAAEEIPANPDTESTVSELFEFHEVIYPIWHTAFPAKDTAMLRGLVGDVERHVAAIEKAPLPGILRDKAEKWGQAVTELRRIAGDYSRAAAESQDEALLAAAEALHGQFEKMVRIIRPALPEVDEFHKVLYVVYHKHFPGKDIAGIRAASADLAAKADAVAQAKLPPRRADKQEAFAAAGARLQAECRSLAAALAGGDEAAIAGAVETLHRAYQELEKIFD